MHRRVWKIRLFTKQGLSFIKKVSIPFSSKRFLMFITHGSFSFNKDSLYDSIIKELAIFFLILYQFFIANFLAYNVRGTLPTSKRMSIFVAAGIPKNLLAYPSTNILQNFTLDMPGKVRSTPECNVGTWLDGMEVNISHPIKAYKMCSYKDSCLICLHSMQDL